MNNVNMLHSEEEALVTEIFPGSILSSLFVSGKTNKPREFVQHTHKENVLVMNGMKG